MRHIFFTITFFYLSCQTRNADFYDAIKSKQTAFPGAGDKKWKAIKNLGVLKDKNVCDTLFSIYQSIDTSIRGFGRYYDVIFNTLVENNTEKSVRTIEKIYLEKHPKYLSQTSIINFSNHKYYYLLFPGILNSLKPDLMNAHWILRLLTKGIRENKISQSDLVSYLPMLEAFYEYTKVEKIKPESKEGLILNIYYWISNPELAQCLKPIKNNPTARKILTELFNDSKNVQTEEEKELSWEAFKALDTTLQSDNYLAALSKDIIYRNKVYTYLENNDRLNELPKSINNQQSLCEMIAVSPRNLRRHDTNSPDKVTYAGMKEINKEFYYFYWICWWKDCKSNSLSVVGPQPYDKTKFNDNPKLKGESISENVEENKLKSIIDNFKIE